MFIVYTTGEQRAVEGTEFDLRSKKTFGDALGKVEGGGYDHCFVMTDTQRGSLRRAAIFAHPPTGTVT